MKSILKIVLAAVVVTQTGFAHAREVMMDNDSYGSTDSRQLTYQQNAERQRLLAQIAGRRAQAESLLNDVELRLDYIAQSEHRELLLKLFEDRKKTAALVGSAGAGSVLLAMVLKGETASGWGDVAAGISKRTSRLMMGAGVVMLGTGLYIGFSERAQVYEKIINEFSKMSEDEIAIYTINKLDEYDKLFDQVTRLRELEKCVNRASDPYACM